MVSECHFLLTLLVFVSTSSCWTSELETGFYRGGDNSNDYEDNDDNIGSTVLVLIRQICLHPLIPHFLVIGNMPEGILSE